MPQLDPSGFSTQLFWLFIAFMTLFLIAWKLALPRITEVLNARRERIDGDLEKAETLKQEADDVLAAYEKALADAALEAQDIHREAVRGLAEERTKRQEELSRRLSQQAGEAEARIDDEKRRAGEDIREAALEVVQDAAKRLIGANIAAQDADRAVGAAFEESRR